MRRLLSTILLILFYLLLGSVIAEAGVRLADAAPPAESMGWFWKVPDPTTGWQLLPNSSGRSFNQLYEYDVAVSVNSRGLRAPESVGYEKPDDVYRVMVLGDSFVEAIQVELAQSFPQQLGQLMEKSGMRVQVLNAGVGGWGTDQQLLWLKEEGYKYHPDLVLLAVYPRNDFMNNSEALEAANQGSILKPFYHLENGQLRLNYFPYNPDEVPAVESREAVVLPETPAPGPLVSVGEWLHAHSALYRYVDPRIRLVSPRLAAAIARSGLIQPGAESKLVAQGESYVPLAYNVYHRQANQEWQNAFKVSEALFAEVKRTAQGMGANVGAVLITAPEQVYASDWSHILQKFQAMQGDDWDLRFSHEKAQELLAEAGVPTLDLLSIFQQKADGNPRLHYRNDGHWTPEGHALAARATFNFLAQNAIVPQLAGLSVPVVVPQPGRTPWQWAGLVVLVLLVGSLLWSIYQSGLVCWLRKFGSGLGTMGELLGFLARRRQFTLMPLVVVLLLFGSLLLVAQASVVGPFIYTLF